MRERELTLIGLALLIAVWLAALIGIQGPIIAYLWLAGLGITLAVLGVLLASPQMGRKKIRIIKKHPPIGYQPDTPKR